MSNRDEMIKVRVSSEEKERFKAYIEETQGVDSLSRFMRQSAFREMNTDDEPASIDRDEIIDAMDVALSGVTERLEKLDDRIAGVEQRVENSDDIENLAHELYDSIPIVGSEEEMRELSPGVLQEPDDEMRILSTPDAWAEYFGVEVAEVRRALARAQDYFPDLKYYRTSEGPRRYYVLNPGAGEF